jgi:hypothetical protein
MVESNRNKRYCSLLKIKTLPDGKYMLYHEEVKIEKFMVKILSRTKNQTFKSMMD